MLIISISNTVYAYILNRKKNKINQDVGDSVETLRQEAYISTVDNNYAPVAEVGYSFNEEKENDVLIEQSNVADENYTLQDYKVFNSMLKQIIILNGYKPKITLEDLLDDNMLAIFSEEEVALYKKILLSTVN